MLIRVVATGRPAGPPWCPAIVERARVAAAVPNYVLGEQLGAGVFGLVLKAEHRRMRRATAIKVMPAETAEGERIDFGGPRLMPPCPAGHCPALPERCPRRRCPALTAGSAGSAAAALPARWSAHSTRQVAQEPSRLIFSI